LRDFQGKIREIAVGWLPIIRRSAGLVGNRISYRIQDQRIPPEKRNVMVGAADPIRISSNAFCRCDMVIFDHQIHQFLSKFVSI
jgi:hypothetical protein